MEIERKFLVRTLPEDLAAYPHTRIAQGYLCTKPVIRIRRQDTSYILTIKGEGFMEREETEYPLTEESFHHLLTKVDGIVIAKTRYRIPWQSYCIELDLFEGDYQGFVMAEIEFPDRESALSCKVPAWFGSEVTLDPRFHNSALSKNTPKEVKDFLTVQKICCNKLCAP